MDANTVSVFSLMKYSKFFVRYFLQCRICTQWLLFISIDFYFALNFHSRGDTTMIISVATGILIGSWFNYQTGAFQPPDLSSTRPYGIIWPTIDMLGLMVLRTVIGLCCVIATRAFGKSIAYAFVCMLLGRDQNEVKASESTLENRDKVIVELSYKFFVYSIIGFNVSCLLPNVFKMLNIGRPEFYTEI